MLYDRERPISSLVTDLIGELATLVRKEGQLARTEIAEKLAGVLAGLAMVLAGAILLIPALVILLQAGIAGLVETGTSPAVAALMVGGAALILGLILALIGWSRIKPAALVPDRTLGQLERDAAVARRAASTTPMPDRVSEQETHYGQSNRAA
jgi:Putative Actinobacterial Holin-X, holin superfamily III